MLGDINDIGERIENTKHQSIDVIKMCKLTFQHTQLLVKKIMRDRGGEGRERESEKEREPSSTSANKFTPVLKNAVPSAVLSRNNKKTQPEHGVCVLPLAGMRALLGGQVERR
jgi:hypothetical protein